MWIAFVPSTIIVLRTLILQHTLHVRGPLSFWNSSELRKAKIKLKNTKIQLKKKAKIAFKKAKIYNSPQVQVF